jgi:hypothetical protein
MIIIRYGSCGSLDENLPTGALSVPIETVGITRNYDYPFEMEVKKADEVGKEVEGCGPPYWVSKKETGDRQVHDLVR